LVSQIKKQFIENNQKQKATDDKSGVTQKYFDALAAHLKKSSIAE